MMSHPTGGGGGHDGGDRSDRQLGRVHQDAIDWNGVVIFLALGRRKALTEQVQFDREIVVGRTASIGLGSAISAGSTPLVVLAGSGKTELHG